MGFSPTQVNAMTLWEFYAASDGYSLANGGKRRGGDISDDDLAEMGIVGF